MQGWRAPTPRKERKKKDKREERRRRKEARDRGRNPYPTRAIDAFIGEEEQNENRSKKKTWSGYLIQLDNMVASYDPHGS